MSETEGDGMVITLEEAMTATNATVDLDWCNRNVRGFMAIRVLRDEVRLLSAKVAPLNKTIEGYELLLRAPVPLVKP